MAGPDANFQQAVDRVAQHLTSEDSKAVAASTATLTLMLQSTPLPADLSAVVQRAAELLEAGDVALQRNAAALISACLESSDSAIQAAIEARVAERAVSLLEGGVADGGLQLNLLVLLGTLGEAAEETAQIVLDAGGLEQLLARADPAQPEQLQEAVVDGLCKLAANHPPAKDAAAAAGAIPRLAALLGGSGGGGGGSSSGAEVQVRALLALGMLAGGSPERQLELAGAQGAVLALLRLMRQQDDADMQQIAAGIFKDLATNADAKDAIAQALKEQQAAEASAKFV
ncbi:importin subunit alpha-7 [Chlorella sorokiniana]|uniref:Importin subunit alpha-7 n=1 Tax=Chlorella sorokiniana TaxID=3076 RepID=A0A2P6U0L0_CHLSO|nr:importin subunit alpha-7 [Chlorella sorokiniana]|eukprot:PRW59849.1 importin subunit alpha-7 [Chlorella sorokiniana]